MQAQAAGGSQSSGGGEGLQGLIQNPKVQIGIVVVGLLAVIAVVFMLFGGGGGGGDAPAPPPGAGANGMAPGPGMAAGAPAANPDAAAGAPAGAPTPAGSFAGGGMPGAMPGAAPAGAPGAAGAPAAEKEKQVGAGVPTRPDPFALTDELRSVQKSIPPVVTNKAPEAISPTHDVYAELNPPEPPVQVSEDEGEGPPVPPMRVAGFVEGAQLSATLQLGSGAGSRFEQVTPGKTIQFRGQTYKVERLEQNTVVLVNNWEMGNRTGVQRIEVTLAGAAGPGQ